jgi:diacylglycerol kinase family enzyme
MDVLVSFSTGALAKAGYAIGFRRGTHPRRDDVVSLRGASVTISGQDFYCSADGERYGPERHRSWRVEPGAFSMPLPG